LPDRPWHRPSVQGWRVTRAGLLLVGARVWMEPRGSVRAPRAAGFFEIPNLAPGDYRVTLTGTGRAAQALEHTVRAVVAEKGFTYLPLELQAVGNR
jgi:hypothetical protein